MKVQSIFCRGVGILFKPIGEQIMRGRLKLSVRSTLFDSFRWVAAGPSPHIFISRPDDKFL